MRIETACLLGGTGFVGRAIAEHLCKRGVRVRVVTRRFARSRPLWVLPTVEVVELTTPPTPPSKPPLLLDDERAELVERRDPLPMVSLPKESSLPAFALALPLVTEVIVAAIGVCNDPRSSRSKRMPMRDLPLPSLFWTTSVIWPTRRDPFATTVRPPDLMACVVFNVT